jgi:hypothetical protein
MTVSVDPAHNGEHFSHPEEIDRRVLAGAGRATKPRNTTGTETNDGGLTNARFNWTSPRIWCRTSNSLGRPGC